ncbi:MAG: hypothetical protein AABY18_04515 [Candidatus Thermoplasmatota archaeon]
MKFPWRKRTPDCNPPDRKSQGIALRNLRTMRPTSRRPNCDQGGFRTGQ